MKLINFEVKIINDLYPIIYLVSKDLDKTMYYYYYFLLKRLFLKLKNIYDFFSFYNLIL